MHLINLPTALLLLTSVLSTTALPVQNAEAELEARMPEGINRRTWNKPPVDHNYKHHPYKIPQPGALKPPPVVVAAAPPLPGKMGAISKLKKLLGREADGELEARDPLVRINSLGTKMFGGPTLPKAGYPGLRNGASIPPPVARPGSHPHISSKAPPLAPQKNSAPNGLPKREASVGQLRIPSANRKLEYLTRFMTPEQKLRQGASIHAPITRPGSNPHISSKSPPLAPLNKPAPDGLLTLLHKREASTTGQFKIPSQKNKLDYISRYMKGTPGPRPQRAEIPAPKPARVPRVPYPGNSQSRFASEKKSGAVKREAEAEPQFRLPTPRHKQLGKLRLPKDKEGPFSHQVKPPVAKPIPGVPLKIPGSRTGRVEPKVMGGATKRDVEAETPLSILPSKLGGAGVPQTAIRSQSVQLSSFTLPAFKPATEPKKSGIFARSPIYGNNWRKFKEALVRKITKPNLPFAPKKGAW
ncbi:hypothetical protein HYFRA_00006591 [Hymenoscyphus fraxineus]|uniref:Uncharacterized protein n=1 Tax=Hymenoscyphus fraxineus TaxID=746836 RepID=A0A9N9KXB9_9HELO|nr:hypothetical protein HYFRA_00006591 [Hymenoscyphus fraxineus]